MSAALQLRPDRWPASGAFGTSAWGTAPFGGQDYEPVAMPRVLLGSDSLEVVNHHRMADVLLTRNGQPVSVRPFSSWGTWRVNLTMVDQATLDALWPLCQARVVNLLPAGDTRSTIPVYWVDQEFAPVAIAPGWFALSFTLEQVAV